MSLGRRELLELLQRHDVAPARRLGQHFVVDPNTIGAVVRDAELQPEDKVLEIGPGVGSLTRALSQAAQQVLAVEADSRMLAPLREVVGDANVEIVCADATDVQWRERLGEFGAESWKLVANLPYNIATPLLLDLLDDEPRIAEFTVMVQREVAERLTAEPGSGACGVPSLKVSYWCDARITRRVPASVFHPEPRVTSAVVRLVRRTAPPTTAAPEAMFSLARTAFAKRRKMLRRSLAGRLSADEIAATGVDPAARPEQLTLGEWAALAGTPTASGDS